MSTQQEDAPVTASAHRTRPRRGGFTLLEIMVTMVLISIVMGIAFFRLDPRRNQSDAGAQVIRTVMEQAMRNSVQRQYNIMVSFDVSNNRLRYVEDVNNNNTVDAGERVLWKPLENQMRFAAPTALVSGTGTLASVVGSNLRTINGMPTVIARRSGALSTDLQVFITSIRGAPTDYRAIVVAQPTGRVELFTFGGSTWTVMNK
jgi:prepilin-type N-terminal cleavage/methylation domain-containing protein